MTDVDGNRDSELNLWRCAGLASPECSPFDLRDFAMSMPIRGLVFFLCLTGIAIAQKEAGSDALKTEAEVAYQNGDFPRCIEITDRLLMGNPTDHGALYLRAVSHVEVGVFRRNAQELRKGIEDARASLKLSESLKLNEVNYYVPYLHGMTALANLEGRKESAESVIKVAASLLERKTLTSEQRANVLYQRAGAFVHLRDLEAAIQDYQAAIQSFPGHLGSHVGLAEVYVVRQQTEKALAAFSVAVETFSGNPLVFNNRGLFLQQKNRLNEAMVDFDKALQLDPQFAVAYTNRGVTQQAAGNLLAAEVDFTEAIKLDSANPVFLLLRGNCRLSRGNAAGAIDDYGQSIRIDPRNSVAFGELGFAKFFSGDFAGSLEAFNQAIALDASIRYLNPWRCWVSVLLKNSEEQLALVKTLDKKPAADRDWNDQLVLFLIGKNSEQDLVNSVVKATDSNSSLRDPQLCEAYYFIAKRRSDAGDNTNAIAFYQQALKMKCVHLSAYRGAQFALKSFPTAP